MNKLMLFFMMWLSIHSTCCTADVQHFFERVSDTLEYELGKVLVLDQKIAFLEYEIAELKEKKESCTNQSWKAYESFKESKQNSSKQSYEKRQRHSLETQWTLDIYITKLKYLKMMQALDRANRGAKALQ